MLALTCLYLSLSTDSANSKWTPSDSHLHSWDIPWTAVDWIEIQHWNNIHVQCFEIPGSVDPLPKPWQLLARRADPPQDIPWMQFVRWDFLGGKLCWEPSTYSTNGTSASLIVIDVESFGIKNPMEMKSKGTKANYHLKASQEVAQQVATLDVVIAKVLAILTRVDHESLDNDIKTGHGKSLFPLFAFCISKQCLLRCSTEWSKYFHWAAGKTDLLDFCPWNHLVHCQSYVPESQKEPYTFMNIWNSTKNWCHCYALTPATQSCSVFPDQTCLKKVEKT